MSNQQQQQPRNVEPRPPQQPTGNNNNSRNLYLDFSRPYERYYNRVRGVRRPVQSGFISSTSWTPNDAMWYKAQTVYAPSDVIISRPIQDSRVTNSQSDSDAHFLQELLND